MVSPPLPSVGALCPSIPERVVSSDGVDILAVRAAFAAYLDAAYARLHREEMRRRKRQHEEERMAALTAAAASAAASATAASSTCPSTGRHTRSSSLTINGSLDLSHIDTSEIALLDPHSLMSPSAARSPSPHFGLPTIASLHCDGHTDQLTPTKSLALDWCDDSTAEKHAPLAAMVIGCEEPVMVVPGALAWPPTIMHSLLPAHTASSTGRSTTADAAAAAVHELKVAADREWLHLHPDRTTIFPAACFKLIVHALPPFAANRAQLRDLLPTTFQGLTVVNATDADNHDTGSCTNHTQPS